MTDTAFYALAAAIAIGLAALGAALAQGNAASSAFKAISRQPQTAGDIRTLLILALAFMETLCIFGLLIGFMLIGKIA
ncbi:MAG: F0F1 ATP synthase subunit C [Oscillospiraceae bacterium]